MNPVTVQVTLTQLTVTAASNATPIVMTTSTSHGLQTGDRVNINAVTGNTAANGWYAVNVLTSTTFELQNSVGNGAYVSGGTVRPVVPVMRDPERQIRASRIVLFNTASANGCLFGTKGMTDTIFIGKVADVAIPSFAVVADDATGLNNLSLADYFLFAQTAGATFVNVTYWAV